MAVAAGIAQREADGSVTFAPPPDVQRAPAGASGGPPPPTVQTALAAPAPPEPTPTPTPAEGAAPPPAAPSGEELEQLAIKLYPRIARQLRIELTRERDRRGTLTDFRH